MIVPYHDIDQKFEHQRRGKKSLEQLTASKMFSIGVDQSDRKIVAYFDKPFFILHFFLIH